MASRKPTVVDGFTAIRAAQEAARHGHGDPLRPDVEGKPPDKPDITSKAGTRIGRSVVPTKREVICPACGHRSEVAGKLQLFVCNGCHHRMKLDDVTLPEGEWSAELETGGTVIVPAGTILTGGFIRANDVQLFGKMSGSEIRASRRAVLHAGCAPDWVRLQMLDLEVGVGVNITPGKPLEGRHLELHGKFCGNVKLGGTLTVHASGDFSGQVRAAGLRVEEGGGLRAALDINPAHAPPPPEPRSNISRPKRGLPPPASDPRKGKTP